MRPSVSVTIQQPCSEKWDAMPPVAMGRHCAACQQTVIDFTEKTDAEIIALLSTAAGNTCGRFRAGQLQRPLQAPVGVVPASSPRWRSWLAAAAAVWGLRESSGLAAAAQQAQGAHHAPHPRKKMGRHLALQLITGVVRDAETNEPLPGVAVFVMGENRRTSTDSAGRFSLRVVAGVYARHTLIVHRFGYQSQSRQVPTEGRAPATMVIALQADGAATGAEITGIMPNSRHSQVSMGSPVTIVEMPLRTLPAKLSPAPRRTFYDWLLHPFRRNSGNF